MTIPPHHTTGIITDIHRGSVVDGPGIRTTVFLKGCPLTCVWCHNPETQTRSAQLALKEHQCAGCGTCIPHCPQQALQVVDGKIQIDYELCDHCMACVEACPTEALFSYGRTVSVRDVVEQVVRDRDYYAESGGGVTISGGEPMMQPMFTLALLKAFKAERLHTCLDTSGMGTREHFQQAIEHVDLFLLDLKASDPAAHKALTGGKLAIVQDRLRMLLSLGAQVRLRCPMVPGLNDHDEHLQEIARLSRAYPQLDGVDILPWHNMGVAKYRYLNMPINAEVPKDNPDPKQINHYQQVLEAAGAVGVRFQG